MFHSPYVDTRGDWDEYWQSRSRNQRRGVNRLRNRLRELDGVSLEIATGRDSLERRLDEAFRIEASGWKGAHRTAITSSPETERFYRDVATWAADRGMLRLASLRVGGRPVSMELSLEADRRYYLIKPGFDPDFAKLGPGKLLTCEMVTRAFETGLESFEFLGGDDAYKRVWADRTRERMEFLAFSPSVAGRLDGLLQDRGRSAARRVLALARRRSGRRTPS